jgi:hypothetical protein
MRVAALYATLLMVVPFAAAQAKIPYWNNGSAEKMCGLGTYHDSLELGFRNATIGLGETLVTVQVLPSFQREYALVFKRVGSEVKLFSATFQSQLWTQLGPPLHVPRTRQACLDLASVAKLDVVAIPVKAGTGPERLWAAFGNINLETDSCPRKGKKCALFVDGTAYFVQTRDGSLVGVTEIGTQPGIKSENPALLDWIHTLLQTVSQKQ